MLEAIITYLQGKLFSSNYFEKVWPLCTIKENKVTGEMFPVHYTQQGEYEDVSNFDFVNGSSYFRKNGDVSIARAESQLFNSCQNLVTVTIPLKIISCVP